MWFEIDINIILVVTTPNIDSAKFSFSLSSQPDFDVISKEGLFLFYLNVKRISNTG